MLLRTVTTDLNSNYMQLILDTRPQRARAAGGYAICLQLCRSLKENKTMQTNAGNCDLIKRGSCNRPLQRQLLWSFARTSSPRVASFLASKVIQVSRHAARQPMPTARHNNLSITPRAWRHFVLFASLNDAYLPPLP